MKEELKKIKENPFAKNILLVASGTATAQVIVILLSPIITRIYGPEIYGVFGVFMSIVGILAPLIALGYPVAIVLPKKKDEAKEIAYIALYITIIFSIILMFLILIFSEQLITIFALEEVSFFVYLIPLAVIAAGMFQIIEKWMIRTKQFKVLAKAVFLNTLVISFAKIGFGLLHATALVLIILGTLTYLLHAIFLLLISNKLNSQLIKQKPKKPAFKKRLREYSDFPFYRMPQNLMSVLSQNIPIILLTVFTGTAAAGFYTIARSVLKKPTQIIGKSVADVFYPHIAETVNAGKKISNLIIKSTLVIAGLGIIPFAIIFVFGPQLFGFVFGPEWVKAGEYASWLSIWLWVSLFNRPSVAAIPVIKLQKEFLIYEICSLTLRIGALLVGFYYYSSDIHAIAFFSLTGMFLNLLLIMFVISKARYFEKFSL